MEYMNVQEASDKWGVSERRITAYCRQERIPGAYKKGRDWQIPITVQKPGDKRRKETLAADVSSLPLPIGISNFIETVEHYYYVDKTLMIRDILDARPKVSLFTRPRRFGKTLNMDMVRTFFEKTGKDTSVYFKDKNIWACGERYTSHQGQYPVIFMTFKDVKFSSWEDTLNEIKQVIKNEFSRHSELQTSDKLSSFEKDYYDGILTDRLPESNWTSALGMLSQCLNKHHGKAPIIIIDEYDTPIQQGHLRGFYDEIILFMRNFFSAGVKDNPNLSFGFLTGILRVAKESIFSGMNNLKVNSIMDDRYSEYFGFTKSEVRNMMAYYGRLEKFEEVCVWYDGYLFGNTEILNPWSVINYLDDGCYPKAFWLSTGSNDVISEIIQNATPEILENMQLLMQEQVVSTYIDTSVIYPEIQSNPSTIYSFLLIAGYLKVVKKVPCHDGNTICDIAIPNKEIFYVYEKEVLAGLSDLISQSSAIAIQQAIYQQDVSGLQKQLQKFLLQTISSHDAASESFYHGMVIGLCAIMNNMYYVSSNRESGAGRYDVQLLPHNKVLPGILIELKVLHETVTETEISERLKKLCHAALQQIETKNYAVSMREQGVQQIMKFGIAFYKKRVEIVCRMGDEPGRKD